MAKGGEAEEVVTTALIVLILLTVFDFRGKLAEYGRAAGSAGGFELHVFDSCEIRVEEVELNLAVFTHLAFGAVGTFTFVTGKGVDDVGHMGGPEGEVIKDP